MKNIIKTVIFIVIFLVLLSICSDVFVLKGNGYGTDVIDFYNQKKNSLDVIFFGSSHSYATFSPYIIEEETNLSSYNFATQQQPINITYHYMIEALKYQKPKYFVLEIRMLAVDDEYFATGVVRDALDKMKFSKNKIEAINESVENKSERMSYYINIIKYHSRYNELTKNDFKVAFTHKGIDNKGFIGLEGNDNIIIDNKQVLKETKEEIITSRNKEYLKKMIKLAKDNGIELILVKSPCLLSSDDEAKYNYVETIAKENNLLFINYNKNNTIKYEKGDFYDNGHLSLSGATKVSKDFSNYLK